MMKSASVDEDDIDYDHDILWMKIMFGWWWYEWYHWWEFMHYIYVVGDNDVIDDYIIWWWWWWLMIYIDENGNDSWISLW